MTFPNPNPRWVAVFLCLALLLPSPAHALRPHPDKAGVEQALTPAAGTERAYGDEIRNKILQHLPFYLEWDGWGVEFESGRAVSEHLVRGKPNDPNGSEWWVHLHLVIPDSMLNHSIPVPYRNGFLAKLLTDKRGMISDVQEVLAEPFPSYPDRVFVALEPSPEDPTPPLLALDLTILLRGKIRQTVLQRRQELEEAIRTDRSMFVLARSEDHGSPHTYLMRQVQKRNATPISVPVSFVWKNQHRYQRLDGFPVAPGAVSTAGTEENADPKSTEGAQTQEWEQRAGEVVAETVSLLDDKIRKYPYGAGELLREARIDILPVEENGQTGYEVRARVNRLRDLETGFYSNGYDCNDAANWIAQRLQSGFREAGIPADSFRIQVKKGMLPIYPTDFYVEARTGSKRWILSATPGLPTLGAAVIGEGGAFFPDEWSALNERRESGINLHLPEMGTALVPAAWVPLGAGAAAKISIGVLPDSKVEKAVIFTYQVELVRVGNPSALGDILIGAVLHIDLDQLRPVRDRLVSHPEWRSTVMDVLGEPSWGYDLVLVYSDMKREVDPQSLRAHPKFSEMERAFQQHQAVLYDLIAGLRSWPSEWDAPPTAGAEELTVEQLLAREQSA